MDSSLAIALGSVAFPTDPDRRRNVVEQLLGNHALGQVDDALLGKDAVLDDLIFNARTRAERDNRRNRFECDRLSRAFQDSTIQPILLKGAAYQITGSRAGLGRRSSDVDILVPKDQLAETEAVLRSQGYVDHYGTLNPYDQAYYRDHMHELPPLLHKDRRTVLDVHHALSPRTARLRERTDLMIDAAIPLTQGGSFMGLRVLQPVDRFCHAALHSLYDGSFDHPLRHMLDLAFLYSDLSRQDKDVLLSRASRLGLALPVNSALWLLAKQGVDIAPYDASKLAPLPSKKVRRWMTKAIARGDNDGVFGFALYIRGHQLRMPFLQLARHLFKKAQGRLLPQSAGVEADRQTIEDHLR